MIRTIYGINGDNSIVFLSLEAAENYVMDNYPEHCGYKEAAYDFCERMIWAEDIRTNEACEDRDITIGIQIKRRK